MHGYRLISSRYRGRHQFGRLAQGGCLFNSPRQTITAPHSPSRHGTGALTGPGGRHVQRNTTNHSAPCCAARRTVTVDRTASREPPHPGLPPHLLHGETAGFLCGFFSAGSVGGICLAGGYLLAVLLAERAQSTTIQT